jgi:SAM-dependent methyltransferase
MTPQHLQQHEPMTRIERIRKFVAKSDLGLEIGPFHSPICPKTEGFNCIVLDVFSRDELIHLYKHDDFIMTRVASIEEVDIVTTEPLALAIKAYASKNNSRITLSNESLDYIISSHNFEHQPNPIRFLEDAAKCLKQGGTLSMAIPIATRCFDCFQPISSTGQFIDAYQENKQKPSLGTCFDHMVNTATLPGNASINELTYNYNDISLNSFHGGINPESFEHLKNQVADGYVDSHCWKFTPFSFELIFLDLKACGFFPSLTIKEFEIAGCEFFVHICKEPREDHQSNASPENRTKIYKESFEFQWSDLGKDFKNQISALTEKNAQLESNIEAMLTSTSWNITQPLRKCKDIASKVFDLAKALGKKKIV